MNTIAHILMIVGGLLFLVGMGYLFLGKLGIDKIPGDFTWTKGNATFAFPLATSIIISIIATILINLFLRRL